MGLGLGLRASLLQQARLDDDVEQQRYEEERVHAQAERLGVGLGGRVRGGVRGGVRVRGRGRVRGGVRGRV